MRAADPSASALVRIRLGRISLSETCWRDARRSTVSAVAGLDVPSSPTRITRPARGHSSDPHAVEKSSEHLAAHRLRAGHGFISGDRVIRAPPMASVRRNWSRVISYALVRPRTREDQRSVEVGGPVQTTAPSTVREFAPWVSSHMHNGRPRTSIARLGQPSSQDGRSRFSSRSGDTFTRCCGRTTRCRSSSPEPRALDPGVPPRALVNPSLQLAFLVRLAQKALRGFAT